MSMFCRLLQDKVHNLSPVSAARGAEVDGGAVIWAEGRRRRRWARRACQTQPKLGRRSTLAAVASEKPPTTQGLCLQSRQRRRNCEGKSDAVHKIQMKLVLNSNMMTCSYQISEEAASISSSPKNPAMSAAQRPGGGQAKICQFKLVLLGGRPIVFLMKPYFYPWRCCWCRSVSCHWRSPRTGSDERWWVNWNL